MAINKGDFIEINYVGIVKDSGQVFDTSIEEEAKKAGIFNEKHEYKPIIICVGDGNVVKGLDQSFIGKEIGKEYEIILKPEEAFGKKNASLLKLVPMSIFKQQGINPFPGLQLNIDGLLGTVRTVTSGRVIVDFNHPLAGKEIIYKVKIIRKVEDVKEKVEAYLKLLTGKKLEIMLENNKAIIKEKIPEEIKKILKDKIKEKFNIELEFKE